MKKTNILVMLAVFLRYLSPVRTGTTFEDISGEYLKQRGNSAICAEKVEIRGASTKLSHKNVLFDGSSICSGVLKFAEKVLPWGKVSAEESRKWGTYLTTTSSTLNCYNINVNFTISRPTADAGWATCGFKDDFLYVKDKKYLDVFAADGCCVYRAVVSAPEPLSYGPLICNESPLVAALATIAASIINPLIAVLLARIM